MKTVICTTPGELALQEQPQPQPGKGEALVRIERVGVCGTDLHAFAGRQPFFSYPRVLGHELAGEVVEVEPNGQGLQAGDKVAIVPYLECGKCIACRNGRTNCCTDINVLGVHSDGGMREMITVDSAHLIKNSSLTTDQLALTECFAIGAHAVRRGAIQPGEQVLVVGTGPIGIGLIQFGAIAGGEIIAMDISPERLQFVTEHLGVQHTIDAGREDVAKRLADLTDGDFPTVIFDATGNKQSMENGFLYLAHGGRYVLVSLVLSDISFPDPEFHKRETTLLSSRNATREDFLWVMECMEQGKVVTEPMVTHRCAFSQLIESFNRWTSPEEKVVKAVIEL